MNAKCERCQGRKRVAIVSLPLRERLRLQRAGHALVEQVDCPACGGTGRGDPKVVRPREW